MNARMRRIASDWEQIQKDFKGHNNIIVEPIGEELPEMYRVTYFINGVYLLPDGNIETLGKHIVEINLHAEYPRYKPICKILTPIWHPNFRDGQICIGDIWGAGESISDIIVNIGDMIQYKSWNSFSPLCAEAAQWAIEHKYMFPVGTIDLYKADNEDKKSEVELYNNTIHNKDEINDIDIVFEDDTKTNKDILNDNTAIVFSVQDKKDTPKVSLNKDFNTSDFVDIYIDKNANDFEITADDLNGIEFIPTAQRMQSMHPGMLVKGRKVDFKTVFFKGILYGIIGGLIGWIMSELLDGITGEDVILKFMGYSGISDLYNMSEAQMYAVYSTAIKMSTAIFSGIVASFIGASMGIGEGIYYGSKEKAIKYCFVGFGIALGIGMISGYIAQTMYAFMLLGRPSTFMQAFIRGIGWSIMGLGVGAAIGLIKPEKKRVLYCIIGGLLGGFAGGFLFDFIAMAFGDSGVISRGVAIVIMGMLIGLGIGMLEQFAKSAWLKVIRGEFEGKEYLLFNGTTSIGNIGKNTIVLFKDKLVSENHCDIILEGNKYILVDKGSPMGTIVNGMRISRHILRQGDAIAIGNSVLVFNTK